MEMMQSVSALAELTFLSPSPEGPQPTSTEVPSAVVLCSE